VVFSPRILRCRVGVLSPADDAGPPIVVRGAEIHASELGAMIQSRGGHRFIDCTMIVHGYRLADEARIVSGGSGLEDGEWSVFAAGSGWGLALAVRIEDGRLAAADILAGGQDYLNNGSGAFLLDVPPSGKGGGGSGGVLVVEVSAGSAVALRIVEPGEAYLGGASGTFEPVLPEHARLVATVLGGEVTQVRVLHCGWRFYQPPVLEIDPAAGGAGASITIGLAAKSFGAWFADAESLEISGGFYEGAVGGIGFAREERAPTADPEGVSVDGEGCSERGQFL
jgi:hypothetical protein